jgi:hypothetical protein
LEVVSRKDWIATPPKRAARNDGFWACNGLINKVFLLLFVHKKKCFLALFHEMAAWQWYDGLLRPDLKAFLLSDENRFDLELLPRGHIRSRMF